MLRASRLLATFLGLAGLIGLLAAPACAASPVVRVAIEPESGDRRFDFGAELLELALSAAGSKARVERVRGMNQMRMMQAAQNRELDVAILPSIRARDTGLEPIAFPLRRGLLGVRLLLARPEDAARLAAVGGVGRLKREFVLGYGHDWLDRREMLALGFRIEPASSYHGLFDMLRGGRFDYLSRGVNEISAELADPSLAGSGMVVVPGIALFYPLDDFFYLRPEQPLLRREIELGLQRLLDDGRYNALLDRHYGDAMRAVKLNERTILHVRGYPVPDGTPLERFDILRPVRSQAVFRNPAAIR